MVEYNYTTGFPQHVYAELNRKIGQYKRNHTHVKIGITGQDPQVRFNQHRTQINWKRMVVIYTSDSEYHCNLLEELLIANHHEDLVNTRSGGGSNLSFPGKNYIYVLLI